MRPRWRWAGGWSRHSSRCAERRCPGVELFRKVVSGEKVLDGTSIVIVEDRTTSSRKVLIQRAGGNAEAPRRRAVSTEVVVGNVFRERDATIVFQRMWLVCRCVLQRREAPLLVTLQPCGTVVTTRRGGVVPEHVRIVCR